MAVTAPSNMRFELGLQEYGKIYAPAVCLEGKVSRIAEGVGL